MARQGLNFGSGTEFVLEHVLSKGIKDAQKACVDM